MDQRVYQALTKFLEDLPFTETIDDLNEVLLETLSHYEIQHCVCTSMYGLVCMPDRKPMFGNWQSEWGKYFVRNGYYTEDPIPQYADGLEGTLAPFYWTELMVKKELSKQQFKIFREAYDAGLREGIVFPLQWEPGELAMVSMAGLNFKQDETIKGILWTIAIQAHKQARALLMSQYQRNDALVPNMLKIASVPDVGALTPTEVNIVQWLAEDMSVSSIATNYGVSTKTVNRHIKKACEKLCVETPTGLVAVAKQYHIIA